MDTKWLVASKTFWGAVIATAPMWLPALGINPADSQVSAIAQWGDDLLALIGGLLVIIGRFKADKTVTLLPK